MDRSAPVYYVAVRKPDEPATTEQTPIDPPPPPPKPVAVAQMDTGAIRDAVQAVQADLAVIKNSVVQSLARGAISSAETARQGRGREAIATALNAATRLANQTQAQIVSATPEELAPLKRMLSAAVALVRALETGGRGGRRLGDRGTRPKPAVPPVDVSDRVTNFTFEDNEAKADRLTFTVDNFDLSQFDDELFARGNIIEFTYGYADGLAPIREAVIRKVTGGLQINVEAHSKDVIMDRVKRRQTWTNKTRSDVVREVAERNGYPLSQQSVEDTEVVYEVLTQPNLTDAQFLRKLANQQGFEFYVDYDGFHWHGRNLEQAPLREFIYYTDPGEGDVLPGWTIENDITRRPARVRVTGINPTTGAQFAVMVDDSTDKARDVLQPKTTTQALLLIDPKVGIARGGEREIPVTQTVAHEKDIPTSAETEEEALVEARKIFRKAQQQAVKMQLPAIGDPRVVGKSVVLLTGWGKNVSGRYYAQQIVHTISSGGYTMNMKLITDGFGAGQRTGKGKGLGGDPNASFESALARLVAASLASTDSRIRELVDRAVGRLQGLARGGLTAPEASQGAQVALALVGQLQAQGKGATGTQRDVGKALVHAAGALAGVCQRIASQGGDEKASGRLNEKDPQDKPKPPREAKITVDPQVGMTHFDAGG